MAVIAPQTDVILLKVPLEINDLNQLTFASKQAQFNYFNSLPKIVFDQFTYQRKDGTIFVEAGFDDIITYNYCMYRNTAYSNKWFYAFIDKIEYENDSVSSVHISTDTWQTWQFDLTFKPVLVEREHTNDDTVGSNTQPEDLELGEIVTNAGTSDFGPTIGEYYNDYWIIMDVAMIENNGENATLSYTWSGTGAIKTNVNSTPSGLYHLVVGQYTTGGPTISIKAVTDVYDNAGLGDAIVNVYMLPKSYLPVSDIKTGLHIESTFTSSTVTKTMSVDVAVPEDTHGPTDIGTYSFAKRTYLNTYVPANNKLLTFPYSYFNISNNAGTTVPFHYEDFDSSNVEFKVIGALAPSGSMKALPLSYKKIGPNSGSYFDYSVTGAKYPMCAWVNDSYTNWLTQNAVNMDTQLKTTLLKGGLTIAGGIAAGALTGGVGLAALAVGGGAAALGKNLYELARDQHVAKSEANLVADQAKGNLNAGDVIWSANQCRFTFHPMCIKEEYARRIDQFWNQFGYATNLVKVPNLTGRRNWNYVKTVGCYIEGDVPQEDLMQIKSMFDKGITLWHNPATFADYSQNNDII